MLKLSSSDLNVLTGGGARSKFLKTFLFFFNSTYCSVDNIHDNHDTNNKNNNYKLLYNSCYKVVLRNETVWCGKFVKVQKTIKPKTSTEKGERERDKMVLPLHSPYEMT